MSDLPMSDINTTPLIDVMLVLLIMFVITIPMASHSVDIDMPRCAGCETNVPLDLLKNKIVIDADDTIRWNGEPINQGQLAVLLARTRALPVEPELQFQPVANASYDVSAHTLNTIKASGVTRFGFVGNERYRSFDAS